MPSSLTAIRATHQIRLALRVPGEPVEEHGRTQSGADVGQDGTDAVKHLAYVPAGGTRKLELQGRFFPVNTALRVTSDQTVSVTVIFNRVPS